MSLDPDEARMWRTDSNMSVLFVSAYTVPGALLQLSRALIQQHLENRVIDIQFLSHPEEPDGLTFTVGAVIEADYEVRG